MPKDFSEGEDLLVIPAFLRRDPPTKEEQAVQDKKHVKTNEIRMPKWDQSSYQHKSTQPEVEDFDSML